jgi:hypothetical protein
MPVPWRLPAERIGFPDSMSGANAGQGPEAVTNTTSQRGLCRLGSALT